MIHYDGRKWHHILNVVKINGSVFPSACLVALPCSAVTAALKLWSNYVDPELLTENSVLSNAQAWSGFSFLVGFLVVFRTSQAYSRFWDGCTSTHQMSAEWFDAASALVSFCKFSKAESEVIDCFKQTLVRLFSMLHACALADIEDTEQQDRIVAFTYELIDADAIDEQSLNVVRQSDSKVELVFTWIQQLVVENIDTGVLTIPPPILTRAFQELANGMIQFHEALKISTIPFPFPYAQACDCLLIMHLLIVPFVTNIWVASPAWAALFSFIQVLIYWSLNFIAVEIENPFGMDANDIDGNHMQVEMNRQLTLLIEPSTCRVPRYVGVRRSVMEDADPPAMTSFQKVWNGRRKSRVHGSDAFRNSHMRESVSLFGTSRVQRTSTRGRKPERDTTCSSDTSRFSLASECQRSGPPASVCSPIEALPGGAHTPDAFAPCEPPEDAVRSPRLEPELPTLAPPLMTGRELSPDLHDSVAGYLPDFKVPISCCVGEDPPSECQCWEPTREQSHQDFSPRPTPIAPWHARRPAANGSLGPPDDGLQVNGHTEWQPLPPPPRSLKGCLVEEPERVAVL